jgi:large subunit ribosomal protein L9
MARRQEVLLTHDVLKLGNMGDIVRVSPGYARNYLFPHALAIPASQAAKRQIEVLRSKAAKSEVEREARANVLRKSMQGMTIQIAARVAHENELFGSIGTRDIVSALAKSGIEIDGKQVHLNDKIKRIGRFQVEIRLHKNVGVEVTLEVVNADPNAPALDEQLAAATSPNAPVTPAPAAAATAPAAAPSSSGKRAEVKIKNLGGGKSASEIQAEKKTTGKAEPEPAAKPAKKK